MLTDVQLKSEIYTAISGISGLTVRWISPPDSNDKFPLAVYSVIGDTSGYSFGIIREAERIEFQIDIYTKPEDVSLMSSVYEQIKTAMEAINYQKIEAPEFHVETPNLIQKASRWGKYNV